MKWILMALILLSQVLFTACQPQTIAKLPAENVTENISQVSQQGAPIENITLESGYEIPQGTMAEREPTYDDIVNCGPGIDTYRARCDRSAVIKVTDTTLTGCIFFTGVEYRDYIETKAGQTRYNIFGIGLANEFLRIVNGINYTITQSPIINYQIKLAEIPANIQVKTVGGPISFVPGAPGVDIYISMYIPPEVKPGDYTVNFILEANGMYSGKLPCTVHVIE